MKKKNGYASILTNKGCASKQSLEIFLPLRQYIIKTNQIDKTDIYLGISGSKEWYIKDEEYSRGYLYDFTIKSKSIIIEYNGEKWHPKKKLKNNYPFVYDNFKTINEKYEYDRRKIEYCKEKGFSVLEIWSDDSKDYNNEKIKEFLNGFEINYEYIKNC